MPRRTTTTRTKPPAWARWGDERLLDLRLCDLDLAIEGTALEPRIERLYDELDARGVRVRPHCWLSNEWFTPAGVPGIAIPFYLAHPRLVRLERTMMLEAEGADQRTCMKILRHEAGHAVDHAYRLQRRTTWRRIFGDPTRTYPDSYVARPNSRRYVLHIDNWYAQSHPIEDFAETFAVWLAPGSQWRRRYRGWPAMKKLEYVDGLMVELARKAPPVRTRRRADPLRTLKMTLREHYAERRRRYGMDYPDFYVRDLRRLFADDGTGEESAAAFLRRERATVRRLASRWTGAHEYTIDQVLGEMVERARELELRRDRPTETVRMDLAVLVTVQTMNHLSTGRHRFLL